MFILILLVQSLTINQIFTLIKTLSSSAAQLLNFNLNLVWWHPNAWVDLWIVVVVSGFAAGQGIESSSHGFR